MSPPKIEIFQIFPYFLRPKSQSVQQLLRQLIYQVRYTRYHVLFYLWSIGSLLTHCKVWKYYDHKCRYQVSTQTNNFDFLEQIYSKRVFMGENGKTEQHHWVLHIWAMLSVKFQLKVTILTFLTKFEEKKYFCSNTKKLNSVIEFCIFELA